jgi:CheY-like chemotaxis protein
MQSRRTTFSVLVAEDSQNDLMLFRRSLRNHPQLVIVAEMPDGAEAIDYLAGRGEYADRERFPFPDLLVLDIRMPRVNGFEVLTWLQTQDFPNLRKLMLSGSALAADRERALALGAHDYRTKGASSEQREQIVAAMEALLNPLPPEEPPAPLAQFDLAQPLLIHRQLTQPPAPLS